jgi:hypothetical protein
MTGNDATAKSGDHWDHNYYYTGHHFAFWHLDLTGQPSNVPARMLRLAARSIFQNFKSHEYV